MGLLVYRSESKILQNSKSETNMMENSRSETYMMENRPHGLYVLIVASLKIANNTVGEQITVKQLTQKRKVMKISKSMIMKCRHHVRVK